MDLRRSPGRPCCQDRHSRIRQSVVSLFVSSRGSRNPSLFTPCGGVLRRLGQLGLRFALLIACAGQTCMQPGEDVGGYHPRNPRAGDVIDPNPDNTIDPASVNVMADAGEDQTVDEGTQVGLDGSLSTGDGALSYTWFQVAGTTVELSGYDQPMASFTAPPPLAESEVLQFRLMVRVNTDVADGVSVQPVVKSDTDDVQVVVRGLDFDGDGLAGAADNCPQVSNPAQEDADGDGAGDACDLCPNDAAKTEPGLAGCGNPEPADPSAVDSDDDGVPDDTDNCPDTPNADQADCDTNGVGNACEAVPTPLVTVSWSPASPTAGDAVTFQANPAASETSCVLDWYLANGGRLTWDFGDGKIAEGNPVSTAYDSSGTYTVKVTLVLTALGLGTLSCDQGLTDGSCKQVSVPERGATVVPIIADVADHTAAVGVAYTSSPTLTQGTAPVTWSLVAGPANMTVNTTTGQVSWPNPVAGTHTVTIRAAGTTGSDDETWVLTVQALPVIADVPDHSAVADSPYSRSPTLTQGSTPVTWSLVSGPSGVTVNASTGAVAWPSPVVGASTITIRATNAIGSDYESWTLTVSASAPVIADVPDHTTTTGLAYSRTPTLAQGSIPVTWSLVSGPAGMSANPSSGIVSWPSPTVGTHSVTIRATNGGGSDDEIWALTVVPIGNFAIISGKVTRVITGGGTAPVGNLDLTFSGSGPSTGQNVTATTAADGSYSALVPLGWTGRAAATDPDTWRLTPASLSFTDVRTARPSQHFAAARNYYVATTGRDTADGTLGRPFATPKRAASAVEPGDTVFFRGGTYREATSTQQVVPVMEVLKSGAEGHLITFRNYGNEVAVFSGSIPSMPGSKKFDAIRTGTYPSDTASASGSGVSYLHFEGLIFEDTARAGILVCGPAAKLGFELPGPPAIRITIRRCVSRGGAGWGFLTRGKCSEIIIELCEAYNHWQTGIFLGRVSKTYDDGLPEADRNTASYSEIRDCLAHNNVNPATPGNTDGLGGSHTWRCAFKDNVVFTNSDDGIDIYASIEAAISGNIVFDHNHPDGNGCGFKISAGGGGRHTVSRNIALNNKAWAFETSNPSNPLTPYYANSFYNNLAYANGRDAFCLGSNAVTGVWILSNNITLAGLTRDYKVYDPKITNSDHNFMRQSDLLLLQQNGDDLHSRTGDAAFSNPGTAIDTNFVSGWSIEQRLEHVRSQVRARFTLKASSPCIDAGTDVGLPFLGNAPDMGPYEAR